MIRDKNDFRLLDVPILVTTTLLPFIKKKKKTKNRQNEQRQNPKKRRRVRRSVAVICKELGPIYFRHAYRMKYESCIKLVVNLLLPFLSLSDPPMARVDGSITNSVRLAVALRYFAGGLPYNITITYDIPFSKVFFILWRTANAVNCCPEFAIEYSISHNKQLEIEKGFQEISTAGFKCCACAVDAMLIWIHERSTHCCQQATCQEGNSSAA